MGEIFERVPEWPKVRCDKCRSVYTISQRHGLNVTGDCPWCHHEKFSTVILSGVALTDDPDAQP